MYAWRGYIKVNKPGNTAMYFLGALGTLPPPGFLPFTPLHPLTALRPCAVYAHMQATGMVNDHIVTCHRHAACAALAQAHG